IGDAREELAPLDRVLRRLEAHVEHAYELSRVAARRVDALEDHRRARAQLGHLEALLAQLARVAVLRLGVQDLVEVREGAAGVEELGEVERAEAELERR